MKASIPSALVLLLGTVNALPAEELVKKADPQLSPVTVNQFNMNDYKCGGTTYSHHDIYLAIQYGVLLEEDGQGRGKKSNQYPNGRFPHSFEINGAGPLAFPSHCPDKDSDRKEYPLVANGPYNGGLSNTNWGQARVVYMHEAGEVDFRGHDVATFCGVMTHDGAPQGSFVLCSSV